MKKMLPAALVLALTACSKKDAPQTPRSAESVWKLTEIAGTGQSTVFHYNTTGEPSAYVSTTTSGKDSVEVSWNNGLPHRTYFFFFLQKRVDRSFVYTANLLSRIQYHNFDHQGQWTVTDYDSLVYNGNRLSELHVINGGARNQFYALTWEGENITRCDSYDINGDLKILTETTTYSYNDQPSLARSFQPWFFFIYAKQYFPALSHNELIREERKSATGVLRWRNTYGPSYLTGGRLERMTRLSEDFTSPATENSAKDYMYQKIPGAGI